MSEKSIRKVVLFICITFLAMAMFGQSALAKENVSDKEVRTISADADFNNSMNHIYGGYLREAETLHVLAANEVSATSSHRDDNIVTSSLSGIPSTEHRLVAWNRSDWGSWWDRYWDHDGGDTSDDHQTITCAEDNGDVIGPEVDAEHAALIDRIERLESFHIRFTDLGDGTVRQHEPELIWLQDADCLGEVTWEEAAEHTHQLVIDNAERCGVSVVSDGEGAEWRLPSVADMHNLMTGGDGFMPHLVDAFGTEPWAECDAFVHVQTALYWTSVDCLMNGLGDVEDCSDPIHAYAANMEDGTMVWEEKAQRHFVWPVRSGRDIEPGGDVVVN
jgi:hypothetical protein